MRVSRNIDNDFLGRLTVHMSQQGTTDFLLCVLLRHAIASCKSYRNVPVATNFLTDRAMKRNYLSNIY